MLNLEDLLTIPERIEKLEKQLASLNIAIVPPLAPKEWYSAKEAKEYLNCSYTTLRRLLKRRLLKKSGGTRHIRISAESLIAYKKLTEL